MNKSLWNSLDEIGHFFLLDRLNEANDSNECIKSKYNGKLS
jgi:hypothetical protein